MRLFSLFLAAVALNATSLEATDRLETPMIGQRILVIAPHIDDEALAAGGYVQDAVRAGAEVYVVYLTAGDHSRTAMAANRLTFFATAPLNRKGNRRLAEGHRAAVIAGIQQEHLYSLGYPDRGLRRMMLRPEGTVRSAATGKRAVPYRDAVSPGAPYRLDSLMSDLRYVIENVAPDIIIAPLEEDTHPDHRTAAILVDRIVDELAKEPVRLGYMIHAWSYSDPLAFRRAARAAGAADLEWIAYDLSPETVVQKRRMLAQYRSQRRSPYLRTLFHVYSRPLELFARVSG